MAKAVAEAATLLRVVVVAAAAAIVVGGEAMAWDIVRDDYFGDPIAGETTT